jgi:hypothetical protein
VTVTDTEIMQTTCNLHHLIGYTYCGEAQDIFDNPTPFDSSKHVFHDHAGTGEEVIQEAIPHTQCLAFGLFFGCRVRMPAGS